VSHSINAIGAVPHRRHVSMFSAVLQATAYQQQHRGVNDADASWNAS
jgi:hypothetical protein